MDGQSRIEIPTTAQRQPTRAHPKKRMPRSWKVFTTIFLLFAVLYSTGAAGAIGDTLKFYARVARLYTKTPDSTLSMPFAEVSKRQIADTWGAPRGTDRVHQGQDIFAPQGTPILSATRGLVYKIGENNLGGKTVSIMGNGGRVYYYAHLDAYNPQLKEGDFVTTKTVLGYVGTTGNAQGTPPHLHFGVYTPTGAINPLPLLSDRAPTATRPRQTNTTRNRVLVNRRT
jgi:murein DD-endopeptidase MepM/ murein hydrolase activator NlpD